MYRSCFQTVFHGTVLFRRQYGGFPQQDFLHHEIFEVNFGKFRLKFYFPPNFFVHNGRCVYFHCT